MNDAMWDVPIGVDADFGVTVVDGNDDPVAFVGDEIFVASLWQGDDLAGVSGVIEATWDGGDPAAGTFVVSVVGAGTALMASDYYRVRIDVVAADGRVYAAYGGWLTLGDTPGVGVAPAAYCTLQDMLDVCGDWLIPLMQDSGKASFIAERARASRYFEKAVLSRSRPYTSSGGVDLLSGTWDREGPDVYLAGLIDAGKLIPSPEVAEAVAYLAAHYVCERQLTGDANDPSRERSGAMYRKWRRCLNGITVGVDYSTDGGGTYIKPFNMGNFSSR